MSNYTRWYQEGTVKLVNGMKNVEGTDTYWLSAGLHAGDIFSIDDVKNYEIDAVTDNTHLTLRTVYAEASAEGQKYSIIRNFTASTPAEVTAQAAALVGDVRRYIDGEQATLHGKSAYEIAKLQGYSGTVDEWITSLQGDSAYMVAKKSGYTGTQSEWLESITAYGQAKSQGYSGTLEEWLESLKAAGELTELKGAMSELAFPVPSLPDRSFMRNHQFRGKPFSGKMTDEQLQGIADGTYTDLFLGDSFWAGAFQFFCAGFNYFTLNNWYGWGAQMPDYDQRRNVVFVANGSNAVHDMLGEPPYKEDNAITGYVDSNFYTDGLRDRILAAWTSIVGEEHVYHWADYGWVCDANHNVTSTPWIEGSCELLTYKMVFGTPVPGANYALHAGNGQLPVLRAHFHRHLGGYPYPLVPISGSSRLRELVSGTTNFWGWSSYNVPIVVPRGPGYYNNPVIVAVM